MLEVIAAKLGGAVLSSMFGGLLDTVRGILKDYQDRKISEVEADAQIKEAFASAQAAIEAAWAKAAGEIYAAAQETIRASFTAPSWFTRNAWAFVLISQTLVLLWYQVGIPMVTWAFSLAPGSIPRTGDDLLMWAYFLVAAALGIGVAYRNGNPLGAMLPKR